MASVVVERAIGAEPTGVALVLNGPAMALLWPGTDATQTSHGRVRLDLPGDGAARRPVDLAVRLPRRTPTAFVSTIAMSAEGRPMASGRLELTLGDEPGTTLAVARLRVEAPPPTAAAVQAVVEQFLANLAATAERRSDAA